MADIVNFNLRLDKQLRDEANAVLAGYGMTTAQAIRLFFDKYCSYQNHSIKL